jgi:hypothetical protein
MEVLLPRDLHIGNEEFESVQEGEEVEFEIVGARFQQGDETIVVLGKLRSLIKPDTFVPEGQESNEVQGLIAAPVGPQTEGDKKTVVVDSGTARAAEPTRRRRIQTKVAASTNEPKPEGATA